MKSSKIILVNPPVVHPLLGANYDAVEKERSTVFPLGLLYIAGALREAGYANIEIVDAYANKLSYKETAREIFSKKPFAIGIPILTFSVIDCIALIQQIRLLDKNVKIILGGPHAHVYPEETLNIPGVDYVLKGEAEQSIVSLFNNIEEPDNLRNIPGLFYRYNNNTIKNSHTEYIDNLDSLPFPAIELLDHKKYRNPFTSAITTSLFSSRGCPFQCTFCDRPAMGRNFRYHSPDRIIKEIERLLALGIRSFTFYDDTFTLNRNRVIDICHRLIEKDIAISFDIRTRIDQVDSELLNLLKSAGCKRIYYGIESGSETVLKRIKKSIKLKDVQEKVLLTKKIGIEPLTYFMIGHPSETREEMDETFRLIYKLNPKFITLSTLILFPSTAVYSEALKRGIIKRDVWCDFAKDPLFYVDNLDPDGHVQETSFVRFIPPFWEEHFSKEELRKIQTERLARFYLRPTYLFKSLMDIRDFDDFSRKFKFLMAFIKGLVFKKKETSLGKYKY